MKKLNMFLALSATAAIIGAGTIVMAQAPDNDDLQNEKKFDPAGKPMKMDQRGPACGMQMPPPPRMEMDQQRGPGHDMDKWHGHRGMDPLLMIEIENPEKAKALRELKDSRPEEFRKAVKAAADEIFEKQKKNREELRKLLDGYRENPSGELKAQIRSRLAAEFEKQMKIEEKMLSKMEEDLKKARERFEKQNSMKDQLIELKLGNIVFEQELRW